jgi:hypothetical protein
LDVLLDRKATDFACFPAVTIEDVCAGPINPEELMLDHQHGITGPAGDPDEILIGRHGTINQHHCRRRATILGDQAAPPIEQHDDEILIDNPSKSASRLPSRLTGRLVAGIALGRKQRVSDCPPQSRW